jgi:hypothetical protein
MKRGLLPVAAVAVAALTLTACGDDDDNDEPTIPDLSNLTVPDISIPDLTVPDLSLPGDLTIPDISIPDISIPDLTIGDAIEDVIRQTFPDLDDEQISCLMEVSEGQVPSADTFQEIAASCDISVDDLIPG